jgi:hypothetical protein
LEVQGVTLSRKVSSDIFVVKADHFIQIEVISASNISGHIGCRGKLITAHLRTPMSCTMF